MGRPKLERIASVCHNPVCQKVFYLRVRDAAQRPGIYCCPACYQAVRDVPRMLIVCANPVCDKTVLVTEKVARTKKYCSSACSSAARTRSLEERFWIYTTKTDHCWIWTGYKTTHGYGMLTIGHNKHVMAHVLSYTIHNGLMTSDMEVCHNCLPLPDNPACVNPAHLWLGTHLENMQDFATKRRATKLKNVGLR